FSSGLISWTAPGDDGGVGRATHYRIRYSRDPITADDFAGADSISGPIPQPPGSIEVAGLVGLLPSTRYYAAVEAVDDGGNAGAISNVVTFVTSAAPILSVSDDS